ncbi:MAG: low molecular weight protein arginine phosphatase [Planctomycetota bacterium]
MVGDIPCQAAPTERPQPLYAAFARIADFWHTAPMRILFVCTGNTCRSPMAAAICRDLLRQKPIQGVDVHVGSAGVAAQDGAPASPQTDTALQTLGITLGNHRSQQVTPHLLAEADEIFTMTRSHLEMLLQFEPGLDHKATVVDPAGGDVPDPIGMPEEVYIETAEHLRAMIEARLDELRAVHQA